MYTFGEYVSALTRSLEKIAWSYAQEKQRAEREWELSSVATRRRIPAISRDK